ncbi:hypothetical protein B484DRAFT_426326 [Ochromonadaceae sp. CCMP2298]|nr:hypothetical protein B484DRAFT_426326 [Ochromonadaceae sp. CCMP2298]
MDIDTADLSGIEALTLQGDLAGDNLGFSVSAAGDVNNDGYADLIVGAPYAAPDGRSDAGLVILGKASGFATVDLASFVSGNSTGYIIWGAAESFSLFDGWGNSVSAAGDVNNDGYADVIVGAYGGPQFWCYRRLLADILKKVLDAQIAPLSQERNLRVKNCFWNPKKDILRVFSINIHAI